jgi:MYXO-CTERM domain-containing protein
MTMRAPGLVLVAAVLLVPTAGAASSTIHAGSNRDGSLYFSPKDVHVTQGDAVSLTVVNDDADKPHDWALLSYGGKDIEAYTGPSETKSISFTADEAGTYRVVCQIVGHKQLGMEGRFIVVAKSTPAAPLALALLAMAALVAVRRRRA